MHLRIPLRAEAQFIRCKAAMVKKIAPAGQVVGDTEIHSAMIAFLEAALQAGPGIIADESSPVYAAPPLPFGPPDDVLDNLSGNSAQDHIARASERRRGRSDAANIGKRIDALTEKIDGLVDALGAAPKK